MAELEEVTPVQPLSSKQDCSVHAITLLRDTKSAASVGYSYTV